MRCVGHRHGPDCQSPPSPAQKFCKRVVRRQRKWASGRRYYKSISCDDLCCMAHYKPIHVHYVLQGADDRSSCSGRKVSHHECDRKHTVSDLPKGRPGRGRHSAASTYALACSFHLSANRFEADDPIGSPASKRQGQSPSGEGGVAEAAAVSLSSWTGKFHVDP